MSVIKKVILTIVLIFFLLFIQSYVFANTCSLSVGQSDLKVIKLGETESKADFRVYKNSDIGSGFNSCESDCSSGFYDQYRACIVGCISENTNEPLNDISLTNNLSFTSNSCGSKEINLELGSNLNFEMKNNTTSLSISGIDSLNTNGKDIKVDILNTDNEQDKVISFPKLVVSGESSFTFFEKELTSTQLVSFLGKQATVEVNFDNLEVLENSYFNFTYNGRNIQNYDETYIYNNQYWRAGNHSSNFYINFKDIENNGNLDFFLKTGNAQKGHRGIKYRGFLGITPSSHFPENDGKNGGYSGSLTILFNNIINHGNFNLNGQTGLGGEGGKGFDQSTAAPNTGQVGNGADGGHSGYINFDFKNIENYSSLSINLKPGKGGQGGDTGDDAGSSGYTSNDRDGGNGGHAGNLNLPSDIESIKNLGNLKLTFHAGDGGNGGRKVNHISDGKKGKGGNAGEITNNVKFSFIENHSNLEINFLDGLFGYKGLTGENNSDGSFSGNELNIIIDYMINTSQNAIFKVNTYKEEVASNKIIINNLQNASFFPNILDTSNKIYLKQRNNESIVCQDEYNTCLDPACDEDDDECEDENPNTPEFCQEEYDVCIANISTNPGDLSQENLNNREIIINNSCYLQIPSGLNYKTSRLHLKSSETINLSGIPITFTLNQNCSICDYYDFVNYEEIMPVGTSEKFKKTYSLFSTNNAGVIPAGELKINYTKVNPTSVITHYNPFTKVGNLPVYVNKDPITPTINQKLGLFEYIIEPSNLSWYYDKDMVLSEKDIFCYYQNYRIQGQTESGFYFNFPFTPIFKYN